MFNKHLRVKEKGDLKKCVNILYISLKLENILNMYTLHNFQKELKRNGKGVR